MNVLKGGVSEALDLDREVSILGEWHQEEVEAFMVSSV